jgi:hypothetical protein
MIGHALKPQDVYDSQKKKNIPKIDEETKIPFFAILFGSLNFLI